MYFLNSFISVISPIPDLSSQQTIAVLGLALIAMGEDIGSEMLFRHFGHLLRYCEPAIRRAVPLALGLISVSNPQLNILDTLSKFSHDADAEVAHNSIFAMGLLGAGTNNARLAALLRQVRLKSVLFGSSCQQTLYVFVSVGSTRVIFPLLSTFLL